MKPIETFLNHVYHGDCIRLLDEVPDGSVDLVVTDPPYLVRYRSRDGQTLQNSDHFCWLRPAFAQIARVLKPDRFCISFCEWSQADMFLTAWKGLGLHPVGHLVWVKPYASATRFLKYRHEEAYLLAKGHPKLPKEPLPDVLPWEYTGNEQHPAQKPVKALEPLIRVFSKPGDVVLDPFMGSGSTLMAARRLERKVIGVEIDREYYENALKRLKVAEAARFFHGFGLTSVNHTRDGRQGKLLG